LRKRSTIKPLVVYQQFCALRALEQRRVAALIAILYDGRRVAPPTKPHGITRVIGWPTTSREVGDNDESA
jgi:hypothetical protein